MPRWSRKTNSGIMLRHDHTPIHEEDMEESRSLKYIFLQIAISVQIVGVVLVFTICVLARYKKKHTNYTRQLPTPDEKFPATKADIDHYAMPSQDQSDTIVLNLGSRGYIQGREIRDNADPLAQYFGGVRYALPPSQRWAIARRLPAEFSYGSELNPGKCDGRAETCPQPFMSDQGSEDCFECNVWMPVGRCPNEGWPVIFYIHGGFLQTGSPNDTNPARLIGETNLKCVIITPVYRLAILGFLSSDELSQEAAVQGEPCGNQGFWDQRTALEWAYEYAQYFGGNQYNITVAGYSAGSFSVFNQLAHDLYLPREKSIIRQAIMLSNGPGVQPKAASEAQKQFDQLLIALNIPTHLPASEKLARLRRIPTRQLIDTSLRTQYHQYRPWHDGQFVPTTLFSDIDNGTFARRMVERNIRLINGECRDEHFLYGTWYTPANSLGSLRQRLEADYPSDACDTLVNLYYPDGQLPAGVYNWQDAFGRLYADVQVHMLERGFVNALAQGGAGHLVYRYRIEYRVECVTLPPEWGVTHSSDMAMWLWGNGATLNPEEKRLVNEALIEPLVELVNGNSPSKWVDGDENGVQRVRRLRSDGKVDVWVDDEMWQRGLQVWSALRRARTESSTPAKLWQAK
ncbi:carboxylesterase, putative [Talaromyces marneffei ATCC 18224]|uniref:Carboxylic ester hydrolase n=1 Tax=Talaromyces marneffei (strain ATCC 18224 / CBS 334.59 / QM 7333) TaxID=441960 RepID=B6QHH4_TALMQ|nr:carboxylesterase, putative [Talaromyces marneffei ATCC 18224]